MQYALDSNKLKRWREERQWSQEHLAELAGVGHRTVQRIESGEKASRETMKALAAAFGVDVMALSVDAEKAARDIIHEKNRKGAAALRLSFYIHFGSYLLGMLIFAGIGIGMSDGRVMLWPAIWWTVGMAGHGLTVFIVEIVARYQRLLHE